MTRVAVFVDYQNVYARARDRFGRTGDAPVAGQVRPLDIGLLLTDRGRAVDAARRLQSVHVFRGEPSSRRAPVAHAAARRQLESWRTDARVNVITRPLQYVRLTDERPGSTIVAREKGIDVLIALALVLGAERDEFDAAVLVSSDTDLVPAVEAVRDIGKRCEVAASRGATEFGNGLRLRGVWCHWLDGADYRRVHDPTDYTRARGP